MTWLYWTLYVVAGIGGAVLALAWAPSLWEAVHRPLVKTSRRIVPELRLPHRPLTGRRRGGVR